ncbi:MAG: hypothetical protein IJ511_00525 [Bacteroides sp.]|nr:hypothetical protein [Bacteroides sp.]
MDISQFVAQFLYRIRYWLLWGSLLVTALVIYFTQFLPYSYTVEGSLYAGVTNEISIDGSRITANAINSTFDNLIGIAKSQGTLQKVSVRLLANSLTYGEEWKDNQYIQAKHYRQLLEVTPKEVLELVDRHDVNKTAAALFDYRKKSRNNFVYTTFNQAGPFYSFRALDEIIVKRVDTSDILNLEYTSADPGITQQTIIILIDELKKAYEELRFSATNDVIAYFEEQVRLAKIRLNEEEDDLMRYCVQERVINYGEETEALSHTRYQVDDRLEQAMREYEGAAALREMLDEKMDTRAQIIRNNTNLLQELNKVSELNQNIMEQEIFVSEATSNTSERLRKKREALKKAEQNISNISDNLNEFNFSKEGVGIQEMVLEWLNALVAESKAAAELKVLKARQQEIFDQYSKMSPVGTQVTRKERAIGIAEDNYRNQIRGLAEANLRKRNIEMNTSNLRDVAEPEFPLNDNGRKRLLYILIAFVGSLVFIAAYFLLIELLDRTLRDPIRSKRLTGLSVIAAFNGVSNLKYRGFLKACNRLAAAYSCRRLNNYLQPSRSTVIGLLSMEPREGKSYLAKYFADYWETEGLTVRTVKAGMDYEAYSHAYVNARQVSDFWTPAAGEEEPDIILIEYPAINTASIPLSVLQQSDVNVLVANACRLWRTSDDTTMTPIKTALENAGAPLFLYLNNADRDVVESFTGSLPPQTMSHSFLSRLAQLGLTSKEVAVK